MGSLSAFAWISIAAIDDVIEDVSGEASSHELQGPVVRVHYYAWELSAILVHSWQASLLEATLKQYSTRNHITKQHITSHHNSMQQRTIFNML